MKSIRKGVSKGFSRAIRRRLTASLLIVALLAGALVPAQGAVQAQSGDVVIRIPLVLAPGRPDFTIISPAYGATVSGTSLFAIQPLDAATIRSVTFEAGGSLLNTDTTAADGFYAFLDTGAGSPLGAAGPLTLTAIATGPGGVVITKSIDVTVVSQPPASAAVGSTGGILATASGNTIIVPPGAVAGETTISVQDKTQQQVTQDEGIDWDALGVTFLGAIDVQTAAPISKPLSVSSVGFGNRIQPGQAVVTYRILPDGDGDGKGELVVVNGANLAPNGTIVSSPVPQIAVNNMVCSQGGVTAAEAGAIADPLSVAQNDLHGPPGAIITIEGGGFNPLSAQGNMAIFHSLVNGKTINVPAVAEQNSEDGSDQTVRVLIPILPPGAATLLLRNDSTASTSGTYNLTVDAAIPLSQPVNDIIDSFFAQSLAFTADLPVKSEDETTQRTAITDKFTKLRTAFQDMQNDATPEVQQYLHDVATMIEGSGLISGFAELYSAAAIPLQGCFTTHQKNQLNALTAFGAAMGTTSCAILSLGVISAPLAIACGLAVALTGIVAAYLVAEAPDCANQPPPSCTPTNTASGAGTTGMGSAPPPGGNACGNAGGGPNISVQSASVGEATAGRFIVKIFKQTGGSLLTPFTGATDPGGYFYIPLIPAGEPFRALATDQLSGASVSVDGVGPALGTSTLLNFDFSNAQQNYFPIAVGDTISNGVPGPGAGNIEEGGGLDIYTFHAEAGQRVFFDVLHDLFNVGWQLHDPNRAIVFHKCLGCFDPGAFTLPQTGTYTLRVGGENNDATGTYQFKLWDVPPPQQFAISIGDTISNGVPGLGAGNIESPGVLDLYTFHAEAGQRVFFDVLGNGVVIGWTVRGATGDAVFTKCTGCGDPGAYTLAQAGTYTVTVGEATNDAHGTYQLKLWDVPPPQQFAISIGDTISNGVPGPGAGNIEIPGSFDLYTFSATAGQKVLFDVLQTETTVGWKLQAPAGETVFDKCLACGQPGAFTLAQTGTYSLTVGTATNDDTGTYRVKLTPQ